MEGSTLQKLKSLKSTFSSIMMVSSSFDFVDERIGMEEDEVYRPGTPWAIGGGSGVLADVVVVVTAAAPTLVCCSGLCCLLLILLLLLFLFPDPGSFDVRAGKNPAVAVEEDCGEIDDAEFAPVFFAE